MAKKAAATSAKSSAKKPVAAKKSAVAAKKAAPKVAVKAKKEAPPKKSAPPAPKMAAKVAPEAKKETKKEIDTEAKVAKPAKMPEVLAEPEAKPVKVPKLKKSEQAKINADKAILNEEERKWNEFHEKHKADKAQSYDMKATFEAAKPLQHKVLGWGWILSNDNDRLEVLFRDGKRILISNYNR